jgi:hypothetical protein
MRQTAALGLVSLLVLSSCATNPLRIPPPPHALPSRPRPTPEAIIAESRPAAVSSNFDAAAPGEPWRAGDSVAFSLEFENGAEREVYWLLVEVLDPVPEGDRPKKAQTRTTLLDKDGTVIGTAKRRQNPTPLCTSSQDLLDIYSELVTASLGGETPEQIQAMIDDDMAEGSPFVAARRAWFNELKRTLAPRFIRDKLKNPAITSTIGGLSVLDLVVGALAPIEVLVDINRINEEQAGVANFDDIPVTKPIRVPFVMSIGGSIQFRFAVTLTTPAPPYALSGGVLEIAGVNEACGEKRFIVRIVSAKRGVPPSPGPGCEERSESRPGRGEPESRASPE